MTGSPAPGGHGRGGVAGARPIPVAAGVVSPPSVRGGRGRRGNASPARRLVAAGATPVTVATRVQTSPPMEVAADGGLAWMAKSENTSKSEIDTLLMKLRKINSELQRWTTAEASDFVSYKLSDRVDILHHIRQAKTLEAKLDNELISEIKLESTETSLQLHQKLSSELRTWVSSKGTQFLPNTFTSLMDILQKMNQELYYLRSSHGTNCEDASLTQAAIAMSAGQLQDCLPNQKYTQPRNERKRKLMKIHDIPFEVHRVLVNPKKKLYGHRIGKSANTARVKEDSGSFPFVSFKRERPNNRHAYYIMAFVCHVNILRLSRICDEKSNNTEKSLVAFVEPIKGTLASLCPPLVCMDSNGFIPTERCKAAFSEIIGGLWFLWRNGLYHGNLNWNTTYYSHSNSVKLANFEIQEYASLEEAQVIDRDSLVGMLQVVANESIHRFPSSSQRSRDLINLLIDTISAIDMGSPIGLESAILDNSFFWSPLQRTEFFATTISIKLKDLEFVNNLPSDLCIKPWTTSYGQHFIELVNEMNAYRDDIKNWSAYNDQSVEHFVRCICGAYAHKATLKVNVDGIVTRAVPLLVEKLRRLI